MPDYAEADAVSPTADAPERKPMTDEEVSSELGRMIKDAEGFIDGDISPQRAEATRYYQGQPFGNEVEGRSQAVVTELRDVVFATMPALMRAFFGPERLVEFTPTGPEDVAQAEQETFYIDSVVMRQDNPGFMIVHDWFKDALVRAPGAVKWWREDHSKINAYRLDNASEAQFMALLADADVKISSAAPRPGVDDNGLPTQFYDLEFVRTDTEARVRFAVLPPWELIYNREARSLEDATIVAHRTEMTTSDLLELGISPEVIEEHGGLDTTLRANEEALAVNPLAQDRADSPADSASERGDEDDGPGPTDRHTYIESYPHMDVNGDGVAELRMICTLGPDHHVVKNVPARRRPFAILSPDPEPHTVVGLSFHDILADLQRIMSYLIRAVFDSASASSNPRLEVVTDQVSMADVLSKRLGAPIRVKQPNMVRAIEVPFIGGELLQVMEYVRTIKEQRVGQMPATLDPQALQSSTKTGVAAIVSAAQQRIEMIARIFAETGFKQLMLGLRDLVIETQPRKRMVRMFGKYTEVDPRTWGAHRDVSVNVALGLGMREEKLQVLGAIYEDQKAWLDKLGPSNPYVTLGQARATMEKILKLQGYPSADEFYNPLPLDWQPPPAPPTPDPAMMVAQAEVQKTQLEMQKIEVDATQKASEARVKAENESAKIEQSAAVEEAKLAFEKAKLEAELQFKVYELQVKREIEIEIARIKAASDREREQVRGDAREKTAAASKPSIALPENIKLDIPAPVVNVPAPDPIDFSSLKIPAPVVNVPAPIVNIQAPKRKRGRRKHTVRKNDDGSFNVDSEEE